MVWGKVAKASPSQSSNRSDRGVRQSAGSDYENLRISQWLRASKRVVERNPIGKRIDRIEVVRDNVFIKDELFPLWFNKIHWKTNKIVIEREFLFREGDLYNNEKIEETMRNLRSLAIFSHVRIVPLVSKKKEAVDLLVQTRDLWSLRVESDLQLTGNVIDFLLLQLTERNFLGRQKNATARFFLVPDSYQLGQVYLDRRIGKPGRLRFGESFDLIFNRGTNRVEGGTGFLRIGKPFYNLGATRSWEMRGSVRQEIQRRLSEGRVRSYDIPETEEEESIPQVWDERIADVELNGALRFGESFKLTLQGGLRYLEGYYEPNRETGLEDWQEPFFRRDLLPQSRRDFGPVLRYQLFTPWYRVTTNLDSYGLSENVRTGPRFEASLFTPIAELGSTFNALVVSGLAELVGVWRDAVVAIEANAQARLQAQRVVDQRFAAQFKAASPHGRFLRLVTRLGWETVRNDTQRRQLSLGGDNGLRGFASQAFVATGGSLVRLNVEVRARAIRWRSLHLGAVAFFDAGTVYSDLDDLSMHYSLGVGLRGLLPQFNRLPLRADLGFGLGESSIVPSFGTEHVVNFTTPDSPLGF